MLAAARVAHADGNSPADVREALGKSATDPQLPLVVALDGGSLGVPSESLSAGLAAALDSHIDPRDIAWDTDTLQHIGSTGFMELSSLGLDERWNINVRVEDAVFRLPRLGFGDGSIARTFEGEHVDSVGLHLTHRAPGHVNTVWFGARVMRRTDSMFGGGVAEVGGRLHVKQVSLFAGAAVSHLRPASNATSEMPAFTNVRGVVGAQLSVDAIIDAVGVYAVNSYGTWIDPFMDARKSTAAVELGAAVRASVHHLGFAIAFHAYLPRSGADSTQYGLSLITSAHQ